jgi:hypothetical protein
MTANCCNTFFHINRPALFHLFFICSVDFARAVALLEQQNERSVKAISARVAAQSHVESMKASATALKVTSMDRAVVTTSSLECSTVPSLGACDTRPLVDFEAKAKPMVRKMSIADKHRRLSRKNPRLRALSFCAEIGNFAFPDIAPITRELVRQGHIKDMLMRKLKGGTGAFPESSTPVVGSAAPPEVPSRGISSMSEKANSAADNRKSSMASNRNNSVTSICSRSSYTSGIADGSMRNLFRGASMRKEKGRRSAENSEVSVSDASDDDTSSDDDDGETYCPTPPAPGPANNANCAISQAMAESHEQLADILFRKSQALLMLSDGARDSDNDPDDEDEEGTRGGSNGLKGALRDALRVHFYSSFFIFVLGNYVCCFVCCS